MYYVSVLVLNDELEDVAEFDNEQEAIDHCENLKDSGLNAFVNVSF